MPSRAADVRSSDAESSLPLRLLALFGEDTFGEYAARGAFGSSSAALEAMLPMMQLGAFPLLIVRKLLWVDLKLASAASRAALAASIINCRRVKPGVPGVLLWKMTLCVDWRFPRAVRESVLLALAHP